MRVLLYAAAVSLVTLGSAAAQPLLDEPYAPFRLVGVMPDTGQVLLWDDHEAEYRLVRAGDDLDGWRVSGLDLKDPRGPRVALQREDLIDELELVRLPRPGAVLILKDRSRDRVERGLVGRTEIDRGRGPAADPGAVDGDGQLSGATIITTTPLPTAIAPPARTKAPAPVSQQVPAMMPDDPPPLLPDDSALPAASAPVPDLEPEPEPEPAPVAAAPVAPRGRRPVSPADPTVIAPPAPKGPSRAPAILEEHRTMSRADFDREINDFDGLMTSVAVAPAPDGGFELTRLDSRSWLASLGFREGDIVRTVAGERVSTVEDAARVYARLRNISSFTVEVQRGATWVHIQMRIRDGR